MFATLRNAWKIVDLRKKLIFTAIIILLYRLGSVIPMPYVNATLLQEIFAAADGSIFAYFNMLSGEAFSRATLFALSISPYITASIVMQLLTIAIPALERLSKEGEEGRKKITQITRYVTIVLGIVTSYGYYTYLRNVNLGNGAYGVLTDYSVFAGFVIVAAYSAGAAIIMWLAEQINERGIGNGISIILFANIIARLPASVYQALVNVIENFSLVTFITFLVIAAIALGIVYFVIYMNQAERRLPVQYAKRQVGRKMYGGQSTFLPIKLAMSGVMPIIFASSIVSLPTTIGLIFPPKDGTVWFKITNALSYRSPIYAVLFFILIIAFAYFYLAISFNPIEVSNNLKKNGGFIPGIRPGKPTSDFITKILNRITLIGAIFLGIIAVLPLVIGMFSPSMSSLAFGGSSIIIVVGVVIETTREIEAQMTMRHYKGFLE